MALTRSRDRSSYRMYPPAPPLPSAPPIASSANAGAPQHIPMASFAYHHHHQHQAPPPPPQPPRQPQNHHQVQASHLYHQPLHGCGQAAGVPVLPPDLAMAAYRQRQQHQHQQPIMLVPQRIQPPSAWDDRSYRHPIPQQRMDGDGSGFLRVESSSVMMDGRFSSDSRFVSSSSSFRPQDIGASSQDRNVYWQPPAPVEAMMPRSYQQRSPSPTPRSSDFRFLESNAGGCGGGGSGGGSTAHYGSRGSSRIATTQRSVFDRDYRNRSREKSPVRYSKASRIVENNSSLPAKQGYGGRRHYHQAEDDDREDGQVTPEDVRRRSQHVNRNLGSRCHDNTRSPSDSLPRNQRVYSQKRERFFRKDEVSIPKKSRFDERAPPAEAGGKKLTVTGHKQAQKINPTRGSHSPQQSAGGLNEKAKRELSSKSPKTFAVDTSHPAQLQVPPRVQVQEKATDTLATITAPDDTNKALTKVVNVESCQEEPSPGSSNTRLVLYLNKAPQKGEAEPESGEIIDLSVSKPVTCSAGETEKVPDAEKVPTVVCDDKKQVSKQAVLTIKKNPSMPVAFKTRAGTTSSKTWHRHGNVSGTSKPTSTVSNTPAYIRKGNTLVRTRPLSLPKFPISSSGAGTITKNMNVRKSAVSAMPVISGDQNLQSTVHSLPAKEKSGLKTPVEVIDLMTSVFQETPRTVKTVSDTGPEKQNSTMTEIPQMITCPTVEASNSKTDFYVKRKTNQLIRNNALPRSTGNQDEGSKALRMMKTKLGKVLRLKKQSSWVWTLGASKKTPQLLPWKKPLFQRARKRRLKALPEGKKGSLLSLISEKLRVLRTSQPLYTRSANGFSLRRSGVRSVDGASLKWTKSLEKRSRKANQEATKAVAAVEKHCRKETDEEDGKSRERIVGRVRYKMDSSTGTLQPIQDSPDVANLVNSSVGGSVSDSALLTPRRWFIGGAAYVRMANGNKLIRDPKSSSRAVASEKVRWSLHNVRSRVIKKQQYCQFFTRFGKCKKADGKCPYIHDAGKVVVCTKFLNGTCTSAKCLLTHKVIPERMPDCSYFLQGLCINEECPYRHVNVNPNAPVCEGFLKGYCASGDECNKKHTYVCPAYAATGECPDRTTCKLHHPKKKERATPLPETAFKSEKKRRYFSNSEIPSAPSAMELLPSRLSFSDIDEDADFISLQGVTLDGWTGETGKSRPPAREDGLVWFNDLPEEEVEKLIKPAFLWQTQQECVPV